MDLEWARNASDTDWIKGKQISALLLTEWHISAFTEKVSATLMQEEYESLYKIIRLNLYPIGSKEPAVYDYPISSSAGKVKIPIKPAFQAFQLKLLFYNSSNMKLAIAKTPDVSLDLRDILKDSSHPGHRLFFSAYTDYGELE